MYTCTCLLSFTLGGTNTEDEERENKTSHEKIKRSKYTKGISMYIRTYIHTYVHVHTYVHTYIHVHVHFIHTHT